MELTEEEEATEDQRSKTGKKKIRSGAKRGWLKEYFKRHGASTSVRLVPSRSTLFDEETISPDETQYFLGYELPEKSFL